jgi:hypothetical protein
MDVLGDLHDGLILVGLALLLRIAGTAEREVPVKGIEKLQYVGSGLSLSSVPGAVAANDN